MLSPLFNNFKAVWKPMKPATPVIRIFTLIDFSKINFNQFFLLSQLLNCNSVSLLADVKLL